MTTAMKRMPAVGRSPARKAGRVLAVAFGALALACGGAQAQGHGGFHGGGGYHGGGYHGGGGYYRGGGWGWGPGWGVLGFGLGLGLASSYYYDQPNYVVVNPQPVYYSAPTYAVAPPATAPATAGAQEPIFYPRSGQNAAQTEADRQACNQWATTQRSAMNDASVFQRATLACMDGRGYTAR